MYAFDDKCDELNSFFLLDSYYTSHSNSLEKVMGQIIIKNNKFLFRGLDFAILAFCFLLAAIQFKDAISIGYSIYGVSVMYAVVAFILVRLAKLYAKKILRSSSDILKMACGNAFGLLFVVIVFSVAAVFNPFISHILPLAIISSLAAFFVMGTVVPAIKRIVEVKSHQKTFRAAL